MNRRRWMGVLLVLVVVGGAASILVGDWNDGHEQGTYLDVDPVAPNETVTPVSETPTGNTTIAYTELSPAQQRVFRQAVTADDGFVAIPDDVAADVWIQHAAVRYRNQTYEVAVAVS